MLFRSPANPLSCDVRNSRGAGAIFRDGSGRLIRPSQDGSVAYGHSFTLNEVLALDPSAYEERPLVRVAAPPGCIGTHTYARLGALEIVDACALTRGTAADARLRGE